MRPSSSVVRVTVFSAAAALSAPGCDPLRVQCSPDLKPASLPEGRLGQAYFHQLPNAGDGEQCSDLVYELYGGALPMGLKVTVDGAISGTPVQSGAYSFQIRALADGNVDYQGYLVTILPP
jgi:hypothetical protein